MQRVGAIIVTYNSELFINRCIEALHAQTHPLQQIVVVDSGSDDPDFLKKLDRDERVSVLYVNNIGYGEGNNRGYAALPPNIEYVLFLNPDVFLEQSFVEKGLAELARKKQLSCVSGKLLGFDIERNVQTGLIDSTGIFRRWYGRWFDRGQGKKDLGKYDTAENVPALCGAALFCRKQALAEVALGPDIIFDPDFFLYKEDIELCLRLREKGWQLFYDPKMSAYHCRGWEVERRKVAHRLRLMSAANEVVLYKKHPSPYIVWALVKYLLVRFVRL